jgi:hypothetical protein
VGNCLVRRGGDILVTDAYIRRAGGGPRQAKPAPKEIAMRAYLQISGTLFGLIALAHALRVIQGWPVEVAGWVMPMWVSVFGFVLTGALAVWALRAAGRAKR